MTTTLGLCLMLAPVLAIIVSAVAFRFAGPGRKSARTSSSASPRMSQARLDVARSVAAGMLAPREAPDDETLSSVLALKDQRKPAHGVKLLRDRTGLGLSDAKRLFDRL
ncbi:hypothetical protein [Nocardia carnea]|uniref:hypothetical protein n=1 Tax=Nocardia carnea TaxID=37328 RepID=UPI00245474B0|nr:hypothetical protein [Nocardia carnea]